MNTCSRSLLFLFILSLSPNLFADVLDPFEPKKTSVAQRDKIVADDWVCINLDSFNDQQGLYAFYINPSGIQMDSRFAGGQEDHDADFVWYSKGVIHDKGYTIEVRIPFKSIRYSNKDRVEMGVIFEKVKWDGEFYLPGNSFLETKRGIFFKASYLWRS